MDSRFPLNLGLFHRRLPRELTFREARAQAEEARRRWAEAEFSKLCFVYAGGVQDSDPEIHAISASGACRLWHFDYFSRDGERFLQVRVSADRTSAEEVRVRAGGLNFPQWRYPFAEGGYCEDPDRRHDPEPPAEPWADPGRCMESLRDAWGLARVEALADAKALLAWICPANWLEVPEEADDRNLRMAYPRNQSALVMRPGDVSGRLVVVRFDLATGIVCD